MVRTAQAIARSEATTVLYQRLADLPHLNPDNDTEPLPPAVADLRSHIHAVDAVVFSTPEYAGAMPGAIPTDLSSYSRRVEHNFEAALTAGPLERRPRQSRIDPLNQ